MERLVSCCGLLMMVLLAWLLSENRRAMNLRLILSGVVLQVVLAVLLLATPLKNVVFRVVETVMLGLIACSDRGAEFVFGRFFFDRWFETHYGGPPFAFTVMPTVILFSALTAMLFHLGVLQWLVKLMARVMVWVMDTSGSESLCAAANVFVGMTTAPLVIRPYLDSMTRSELMAMMSAGMATVAGGTMAAYVGMAPDRATAGLLAGHLAVASLISAPAALVVSKIMVPETEQSPTKGEVRVEVPRTDANLLDAACRGAGEGLKLVLNIVAMLIAFIALVHVANWGLAGLASLVNSGLACLGPAGRAPTVQQWLGGSEPTVELLLGWLCAPLAWILGVPWTDAPTVGVLIGEKTIFNEFVAYGSLMQYKDSISPRSFIIATYALCGFANFGSIAVTIGGISTLSPQRRPDFARYGFRSMLGGALAAFMTAAIAGMLLRSPQAAPPPAPADAPAPGAEPAGPAAEPVSPGASPASGLHASANQQSPCLVAQASLLHTAFAAGDLLAGEGRSQDGHTTTGRVAPGDSPLPPDEPKKKQPPATYWGAELGRRGLIGAGSGCGGRSAFPGAGQGTAAFSLGDKAMVSRHRLCAARGDRPLGSWVSVRRV